VNEIYGLQWKNKSLEQENQSQSKVWMTDKSADLKQKYEVTYIKDQEKFIRNAKQNSTGKEGGSFEM